MKMLALEFSSPQRSVAAGDGAGAVGEAIDSAPGNTMKPLALTERALRLVGLEREQIEVLVIGLGPGSYTGIRAAIALAQGWQLGRGVNLLGVSSAEAIAAQAQADGMTGKINVVIDAQRGEFYLAGHEISADERREVSPLRLATLAEARLREQAGELLIGPEVTRWFPEGRIVFPRAAMLAQLAKGRSDFMAGENLEPIYLRETTFVKAPPSRILPAI